MRRFRVLVPILSVIALLALVAACAGSPAAGYTTVTIPKTEAGSATAPSVAPAESSLDAAKAARELDATGGSSSAAAKDSLGTTSPEIPPPAPAADEEPFRDIGGEAAPGLAKPSTGGATAGKSAAPPSESGLKAGYSDDNEQFNYFVDFLAKFASTPHYELLVGERVIVKVTDSAGKPVANAKVTVRDGAGKSLASGQSYADGSFYLYPLEYEKGGTDIKKYKVAVDSPAGKAELLVDRNGPRSVEIKLGGKRTAPAAVPMDMLFILDTTGSMGEEIERLRATIEIIYNNLVAVTPKPAIRFGMVLYKDRGDSYVTRKVPFTADLDSFQASLELVSAGGGGDYPEDLQAALKDAIQGMDWNPAALKLSFVVTDASPQLYPDETFTYADAARAAKAKGIKIYTVGAGGMGVDGEYPLRQLSQYTAARYIFLTYGEKGEAAGGATGSVSHHTGDNFVTDKLEAIVIRFAKEELSWLSDVPLSKDESFFTADKVPEEEREATLSKLFAQAMQNLSDYSTLKLTKESRVAVLAIAPSGAAADLPDLKLQAEYFTERLMFASMEASIFTLIDRANLDKVLKEQELMLSGIVDDATAVKVGKLAGAELLIVGTLYKKGDRYELYLKLLRVETGEILSIAKSKVDVKLGK